VPLENLDHELVEEQPVLPEEMVKELALKPVSCDEEMLTIEVKGMVWVKSAIIQGIRMCLMSA